MSLHPSDRKKLLALPFALSKRSQNPDPQMGTVEMELYEELTGRPWYFKLGDMMDDEKKITEFDFENFIAKEILQQYDTSSDEFRDAIRVLNFYSKTQIEQSDEDKEAFRKLMPLLSCLPDDEKRSLVHLLKN